MSGRDGFADSVRDSARAYPALLRVGFAAAIAYRAEFIIWMFTTNMPLVMLALWAAVARSGPVAGYTAKGFTAYYLTTLLVRLLTGCWVVWELTFEIRQGTLGMRLLRPIHPLLAYSAENLSALPLRALFALPIVAVLVYTSASELTRDPLAWLLLLPSIFAAFLIIFFVQALIGTLALFVESAGGLFSVWLSFSAVLSGYLVPLDLFPPSVRAVTLALPFRFTLSYPVELVLGRLDRPAMLQLFLVQWAWVLVFALATRVLWRSGLKRFGAFGG
jgi:ABC-2 type transport system permease protein